MAAFSDVIFDFCDVLVDWKPRVTLTGQVPEAVIDRLFDRGDPNGFWHYDELSDLGWGEEWVLADYAAHHGLVGFASTAVADMADMAADMADTVDTVATVDTVDTVAAGEAAPIAANQAAYEAFRLYFARQRLALVGMLPGMPELLRDLHAAGVHCWGLTNFTVKYVDAARELFPELNLLKDVVVSSAERIHKPDPEIFRRAIARFGVDPAHTAFVDDKPWNAEAGTAAGLHGIRFTDAVSLRARLLPWRGALTWRRERWILAGCFLVCLAVSSLINSLPLSPASRASSSCNCGRASRAVCQLACRLAQHLQTAPLSA